MVFEVRPVMIAWPDKCQICQDLSVLARASVAAITFMNIQQRSARTLAFGNDASITKECLFPHNRPVTYKAIELLPCHNLMSATSQVDIGNAQHYTGERYFTTVRC